MFTRAIKEGVACIHKNLSIQVNDISHWMKDGNSSLVHLVHDALERLNVVCTESQDAIYLRVQKTHGLQNMKMA